VFKLPQPLQSVGVLVAKVVVEAEDMFHVFGGYFNFLARRDLRRLALFFLIVPALEALSKLL